MNDRDAQIVRMLNQGTTAHKLAYMFGLTPKRIRQIGRDNGVVSTYHKNTESATVTPEEVQQRLDSIWADRFAGKQFEPLTPWESRP